MIFVYLILASTFLGAEPRPVTPRQPLDAEELATIGIFEKYAKSVVHITTATLERQFFSLNVDEVQQGSGAGFIWDEKGHIVTNYHVIRGANMAQVTLANQKTYKASYVGGAPEKDLAVLKIIAQGETLSPIPIGESHNLKVGQKVLAIGNPFGLDQTLTTGIISALGREINSVIETPIKNVIQTDAAINPGNSGGPLLDSAGRLIGVNTAIFSPTGSNAGIGFAIPIETVNWVVPELITHGKLTRPDLGVSLASDRITRQLGIEGALVLEVERGSSAEKAGLVPTKRLRNGSLVLGDIIVGVESKEVLRANDVFARILSFKVGDSIRLKVYRNGKLIEVPVKLGLSRTRD